MKIIILTLLAISFSIIILVFIHNYTTNTSSEYSEKKNTLSMKSFIINLDKNTERWNLIKDNYYKTDLATVPMERFSAIDGKKVDITNWLNEDGIAELKQVEKDGYRTKHYQTTRGGIGCFLSHLTVAQKLLDDAYNSIYLVLEDDAIIPEVILKHIKYTIQTAPENWDFILLGNSGVKGTPENDFIKVEVFFGTFGYLVNKKGAQQLINSVNKTKIDAQIDSYMSWLINKRILNIYSTKDTFILHNNAQNITDIQMDIMRIDGENPYIYKNIDTKIN
jgi:GR25 family glycosyltransferase involved in LPS biosynthesis